MEILEIMLITGDLIKIDEVVEIGKDQVDIVDDKGNKLLIDKKQVVYMVHT